MEIEILSFVNNIETLKKKSESVGIFFFPENFDETTDTSKFIYSETTSDLKKIFKINNQEISYINNEKPLLRVRKSADWFGPAIFISFSTLVQNPELISISLNLISSYLYDFFKGSVSDKKVKLDIIVENKKKTEYSKIQYEGNIEGLKDLENIIKQLKK